MQKSIIKNNKLGYFISSMLAGIYVGMAIMLILQLEDYLQQQDQQPLRS